MEFITELVTEYESKRKPYSVFLGGMIKDQQLPEMLYLNKIYENKKKY